MNNSITGTRIRDRRKELGLTADALAEMIGVSRATIFRYENGAIEKVPADLLFPLAKHLSVSVSYLLGISDDISADSEDEQTADGYYVAYDMPILSRAERKLLTIFHHLNSEGQERLLTYADDLASSGKYIKTDSSRLGEKDA